jgi:biopolymer transport protein TolR
MTRPATPDAQSEPNVLPLIDVLLVLIIVYFTAVAVHKMEEAQKQKALFAQVPPASATSGEAPPSIVLEVGPDGYRVNRTAVAPERLAIHLREIYDGRPDKILFVKGDPTVSYQTVFTAMDIARGAGVRVLGIPPKRSSSSGGENRQN